MTVYSNYKIDERTASDIRNEIAELAKSYTPEWKFDIANPDIGSVIALIFAHQTENNIFRFNQILEKYRTEFVNMYGIVPLSAKPAHAAVVMEPGVNTAGVSIVKGTQLIGESENGRDIIFETLYDMYVTGAALTDIIGVSGHLGKIIPFWGKRTETDYFGKPLETAASEEGTLQPIPLFSYTRQGIQRQALLFYHSYLFDVNQDGIGVRFHGRKSSVLLAEMFMDREKFRFSYLGEDGVTPYEKISRKEDTIYLHKRQRGDNKKRQYRGREMSVIILEMLTKLTESIEIDNIEFKAFDGQVLPSFLNNGSMDMDILEFTPFGEQLSLYQECYIGQDTAFTQIGAEISIQFTMEFGEKKQLLIMEDTDENLPVIKRKPRRTYTERYGDCLVQEISIEYFNGTGWKRLPTAYSAKQLFAQAENTGVHEIRFAVPQDWERMSVGGYEERCIRLRVERADNCYMRPVRHVYPIIKNMVISYSYCDKYVKPEEVVAVREDKERNLTQKLEEGRGFIGFQAFPYTRDYMYFGFDKKFDQGPVSILLDMQENSNMQRREVFFEYSAGNSFKPLRVIDNTNGLQNSGTVLFQPPADMGRQDMAGRERYWIRIADRHGEPHKTGQLYPVLKRIYINAADVWNVRTEPVQEYTMDAIAANMSFALYAENILSADVWVNEKEQLSPEQMRQILKQTPDKAEAEYNYLGEIEEFYVRWSETENFDNSSGGDRHYMIDRMNNRILFGDGVKVRIPRNIRGIAFRVKLRCCDGEEGNVSAGSIQEFHGSMLFVDNVINPLPAFGGSSLENVDRCLSRAGNFLSGRKRLVSENDYIREIMAYSDLTAQVRCVPGRTVSGGRDERVISLVVLMKDYKNGSFAFRKLKQELMEHLPKRCEMLYQEDEIEIVEPVFVYVSVDVWVRAADGLDSFELQSLMQEQIENYLEPIQGAAYGGWRIGSMPREKQIRMMLGTLENTIHIERYAVHASYRDEKGVHETDLEQVQENPFAVCCNGRHRIYVMLGKENNYAEQ